MSNDPRFIKAFRRRRQHVDHMRGEPWHRLLGRRIEQWNKRLTLGALSAWIRPRKVSSPLNPQTISTVLIIRTDAIGDMVLSTAIWRVLKRHYPHLKVGVVGSFRNLSVIANDPDVDQAFELIDMTPRNLLRLVREVRAAKWNVVIPLTYNRKTKMALLSKLFAPHALASMVLFRYDPIEHYHKLFAIVVESGMLMDKQPILDLIKVHLEGTFAIQLSDEEWRPSLFPNEGAVRFIGSEIEEKLQADGTSGFIHVNLEARTPFREFGIENSFGLSRLLRSRFPELSVIWTTSPASSTVTEAFLAGHPTPGIHFQKTRNIDELIGLVRHAALVVTPDTSVVHIAAAEQKSVVALFRHHSEWHPYKVPSCVLIPSLGEPVSTIPVAIVLDAATDLLNQQTRKSEKE